MLPAVCQVTRSHTLFICIVHKVGFSTSFHKHYFGPCDRSRIKGLFVATHGTQEKRGPSGTYVRRVSATRPPRTPASCVPRSAARQVIRRLRITSYSEPPNNFIRSLRITSYLEAMNNFIRRLQITFYSESPNKKLFGASE